MPPRIHLLPDRLVSQIAAGEVVERPASVVKELLENALDAGATEVTVELEGGGRRRIRVADDGHGMGRDDALLAFDRHATSKISDYDDLLAVATLGFRGEALASIAAVARVELVTAEEAGEGWRVRIEGGRVRADEPAARARGTTVEVASLFYNVPARRKFLKTARTELRRAVEVAQGYALVCPEVRLVLSHEGRHLLDLIPAAADAAGLRHRIEQLFGRSLVERLVEVPQVEGPEGSILGFVGRPDTARGRRNFVFVNGRLIRDRVVMATFYRSVREEWKSDEFPALFLFLALPPEAVDVNVHPQKSEVRFRDRAFLDRLRDALREALGAARGEHPAVARPLGEQPPARFSWEGAGSRYSGVRVAGGEDSSVGETPRGYGLSPGDGPDVKAKLAEPVFPPPAPVPLSGVGADRRSLRILGQYKGALILVEAPDGLLLVDQHAAHERVLYERLRSALEADEPEVQRLVLPQLLELSAAERMRLEELVEDLGRLGFEIMPLSGRDLALVAAPAVLGLDEAMQVVGNLTTAVEAEAGDAESVRRAVLDAVAAEAACRGAIKIHHPLPLEPMQELLGELFRCRQPFTCPHGRPTVLKLADGDLERRFQRR